MTCTDAIAAVLRDHQYGFMGHCVNERGLPDDCGWSPSRRRKESLSEQHREHLAEQIAAVVCPPDGSRT
jgi:hypothetical protein